MKDKNIDILFPDYVFDKKVSKYLFVKHIVFSPIYAVVFILYPIFLLLKLFETKIFSRILKQIAFVLYVVFMLVLGYTLLTQNVGVKSDKQETIEVQYEDKLIDIK